ncbi:MAG TPA: glycosyltransferase [Bryobacteraceae bacterium]|nr:glycosyltransferase [Bryobacteraceae bacterium]
MTELMDSPVLSVVIIGRNEGPRLERCLRSVREMENPGGPVEVIYVDSSSTDGSPDMAARLGAIVVSVQPRRPTAALGRNAGWRRASAPFILFLDGDTILDPRFVVESLREFQPDTAVVFGHRREIRPEASVYNRVLDLDWLSPAGVADYCGGDALMRRSVLEMTGGYDENLIAGEEPELCRRMRAGGWKILHADRPMTGHDLAMTNWSQYWRRARRTGYAYAEVSERFRGSAMPFWEEEARHNRSRALFWIGLFAAAAIASLALRNPWPLAVALAFLGVLAVRTSKKIAWKSPDPVTRLLYGLHSHIQQLPIFLGQLEYRRDRRKGRTRGLIEYKEVAR